MCKLFLVVSVLFFAVAAVSPPAGISTAEQVAAAAAAKLPDPVLLWDKAAPGATGDSEEDKPAIYPFLPPKDKNTGAAIIVAPGGGFTKRCADYEGVIIARWLNDHGIAAFVLRYRLNPLYTRKDATLDGQRSVQFLRAHAADYNISADRIGMIGFSAGSELEALVGLQPPLAPNPDAADLVERQSGKLDFMILAYGSSAGTVDRNTPPTFMFCTAEDRAHATGMINLYQQMYNANVPAEIHIFPHGEHGVGLANGDAQLGLWPDLMYNWLRAGNFLTAAKRSSVHGTVKVDGVPLPHGSITFIPADAAAGTPPVTSYIMNSNNANAEFAVAANAGPVPGKYRVEVRQDAVVWISNARDPSRGLPQAEKLAYIRSPGWGAPTIDQLRVFKKAHPADSQDLIVEIKPGDNLINVEIQSK